MKLNTVCTSCSMIVHWVLTATAAQSTHSTAVLYLIYWVVVIVFVGVCGLMCIWATYSSLWTVCEAQFYQRMSESILSGLPRITFPSTTCLCNDLRVCLVLPGHFQIWKLLTVLCDCWRNQTKQALCSDAHHWNHWDPQHKIFAIQTHKDAVTLFRFMFCSCYDPPVRINCCTWSLQSTTEFTLTWFSFSEASFHWHIFV